MTDLDLRALNSATKYPSIPTYHPIGEKGILGNGPVLFPDDAILTEKVDGTNGRVILLPEGDWFIGSREELLTARDDRVYNANQGIVDALRPFAEGLQEWLGEDSSLIWVYYLEVYGGRVGANAKQYSTQGKVGYRLFDLAIIHMETLDWDRERIASWRDGGGQKFTNEASLISQARANDVELTPRLGQVTPSDLPFLIEEAAEWLEKMLPESGVRLDETGGGRPEGIVLRTSDRRCIAKARFEDYRRTLKARR